MYAQLSVAHRFLSRASLRAGLEQVFGPDDRAVIERSEVCSANSEAWKKLIAYSIEGPTYRLVCLPARNDELQVIIEPIGDEIRRACQSAWNGLRTALTDRPTLQSGEVCNSGSGRVVMTAQTGFAVELRRSEIVNLTIVGVASAIWVAIGAFTFARSHRWELFGGALPSLVGGLIGIGTAIAFWRGAAIRWQE